MNSSIDPGSPDGLTRALDPRTLFNVNGRVIIVTGATRGLGAAMAEGLAACGARVVVVGRSRADADSVVARIASRGHSAVAVAADVATDDGPALIVDAALSAFGGIDVLINNAGTMQRLPVEDMSRGVYR